MEQSANAFVRQRICLSIRPANHRYDFSVKKACLVPRFINTTTFAARDFWPRLDASDAHTLQGSVRSEQRRLGQKEPPPGGLRRIWLLALLLLGHRALAAMLPRRASPEAKCGATNVVVFMKRGTKSDGFSVNHNPVRVRAFEVV